MKTNILLIVVTAFFSVACATSQRDPASVKQEKEARHQQFQHGVFDQPIQ